MQDFPWHHFVHRGGACPTPRFKLFEFGVSGSASDVVAKCESCGSLRRMSEAFDRKLMDGFLTCAGHHPHLGTDDECAEQPRTILLGATNSWFPVLFSVLHLPSKEGELRQLVDEHWSKLSEVDTLKEVSLLQNAGVLKEFGAYENAEILAAIVERRGEGEGDQEAGDLKRPEWEVFTTPSKVHVSPELTTEAVPVPEEYAAALEQVLLVTRLREVRALAGFTRIDAPGDFAQPDDIPPAQRARLTRQLPTFVPAADVRGEGIFIRFREDALTAWLSQSEVRTREQAFLDAHYRWREKRGAADPAAGFPGMRFMLLHTFAHGIMRRIALECGYSAAGIRERIYASGKEEDQTPMAGVLIYTAAPDAEGTLGGLVHLGRPENLKRVLASAFEDMALCSSDPLCARHDPPHDGTSLHGVACHSCLFSPETSCEAGNRYLDRAALVPVFDRSDIAFFHPEHGG
jgi:hypothetical protein